MCQFNTGGELIVSDLNEKVRKIFICLDVMKSLI